MSTRSSKGQGLIGQVLVFGVVIFFSIIVFVIMASTGNITEQSVQTSISHNLGEVRKRSVLTSTLADYMWRADTSWTSRYGNRSAYRIISYHYSTGSGAIYVGDDNKIPNSTVHSDIKKYLEYKMQQYWWNGPNKVPYAIVLEKKNGASPGTIIVKSPNYKPSGEFSRITVPIALADGKKALFTMWTKTSSNIYSVS
ncbi:MAG: hypothetical protein ABEJ69_00900 [Candidatus Nanohaloarchaea archaeon]